LVLRKFSLLRFGLTLSFLALLATSSLEKDAFATQQNLPLTAEERAGIDKDNSRHFGDDPEDGGPLATDLSPKISVAAVDKAIRKVADWELARAQPYFDLIWTSSVLYTGLLAASDATGDARYRDAVFEMAEKYHWETRHHLPNADDQSVGQAYLELYLHGQKKNPEWIKPIQSELDASITAPEDPQRIPFWWCDALFMAPPVWARMYAATGEGKYLDYLDQQWSKTYNLLYDHEQHLFFRDATFLKKTDVNGKEIFWSRGNGWVMGGIVRTLQYMPKDDKRRATYIALLQEMAERVKSLQGKDGLWHASLLDSEDYPLPEVSGSALFTYSIAWGINEHLLDKKLYTPVVQKAWRGMLSHVYADGRIGCIQQTGAAPAHYRSTASYDYGVGAFLLAGSEIRRMAKH
jgi:unsaturated rhamnogalacturonyl hydrolase